MKARPPRLLRWDIFCNVVDNYGDIGVCWRLARQLAAEHGLRVRLWVDNLASLQKLCPQLDPRRDQQTLRGVDIRAWRKPFVDAQPAQVVVEGFGCALPENYLDAMSSADPKPVWVNLEYLSAEQWVGEHHALPSPHPRLPLTKYFFFPGFTEKTGGLLRERDLLGKRDAFLHDINSDSRASAQFWGSIGIVPPIEKTLKISLFAYARDAENAALPGLLDAWAASDQAVLCLVPEGGIQANIAAYFGVQKMRVGETQQQGNLTVQAIPFVAQEEYDKLLWACDCNFVRGEDSFVRAQWAGKPMVWQIYPQHEDAHLKKLDAFLTLYCAASGEAVSPVTKLWHAWNQGSEVGAAWSGYWRQQNMLLRHAENWCKHLQKHADLATELVLFCEKKL